MRAENFGERVYWDLWRPTSVKSLNSNSYMAACIDDATRESKLYFQQKKSQTFESYKQDKAYMETQTRHRIKASRSDQKGEFLLDAIMNHQNQKETLRELTVHDSPLQNGVSKRHENASQTSPRTPPGIWSTSFSMKRGDKSLKLVAKPYTNPCLKWKDTI
jgi:hypothetical protein